MRYYIYNKVKRIVEWGALACLLALMPIDAYADFAKYGIPDGNIILNTGQHLYGTWNAVYQTMLENHEISADFSGSGTHENPYQINTVWDLCRLEDQVNKGNEFKGKYFKLVNDIDLSEHTWYPIGVMSTTCFSGLFDGNDKTISNMCIVVNDADNENFYSYGLFGNVKGVIRHLNMTGGDVTINRTESNQAQTLFAGLLCGNITYDMNENMFGAVYECNIQGSIGGFVSNYSDLTYIGGLSGIANNPVAIYKCQVDVRMTSQDIRHVGGIVGWYSPMPDIPISRVNGPDTPCVSYIFDCVANVYIWAELRASKTLYCGGICGSLEGEMLACVANGTIRCNLDMSYYNMQQVNMSMGGLTGFNGYTITSCVSTVQLKGGKTVGGLIGENDNINGPMHGNVLNSVFCGHIDSPDADHTHGLVGNQKSSAGAPFNCLFVGTMHGGKNKAPLSNGDTDHCYSDWNMYDDGNEWSCYKYTDQFGSADNTWFVGSYHRCIGWESKSVGTTVYNDFSFGYCKWVFKEGFYPYFMVDNSIIAGNNPQNWADYVIRTAALYFGDNEEVISTPSMYGKYAWLGSVPMNVPNHAFCAGFVDTPVSLAIKQQQIDNTVNQKTATYSVSGDLMTVSGEANAQTATPKDNVEGGVMLTITSDDHVSRQICLDVYTSHKWDGKIANNYDGGNGTEANPFLIHNARQLMKALTTNGSDEYYRLTKDIWFNENLLTNTGEPNDDCSVWDHQGDQEGKRDVNNWKAHLDGDGHLVHGLYSKNAFGLLEKIHNDASIENVGFVDCLVWSPEKDPFDTKTGYERPLGFFTPIIGTTAAVRNCLFDGVVKDRRTNTFIQDFNAFIHTIDNTAEQIGANPIIEDCVLSIVGKSDITDRIPEHTFLAFESGQYSNKIYARRVLVLNNSMAEKYLTPSAMNLEACHYPQGYLPKSQYGSTENARQASLMTDGTFFSGEGFDKWTAKEGRFPMLKSFAETPYGKLISLPIYTDKDNRLDNMNYLLDFTPSNATWQVTNGDVMDIDTDICVLEPKAVNGLAYLVRTLDDAKMITPITTAAEITAGIKFEDEEAKKFCVAHYDDNGDGEVSLSELKGVTLNEFQEDMNENDNDPDDNDGNLIERFPEFRYFASIDDLGTSFQDKDKLQQVRLSGKITELSDNDFKGNSSMTSFTIPTSVTSVSGQAFYNSGLQNYEVVADHSKFAAIDGLLMNKDKDQLLSYPSGRKGTSITVPDNVKSISDYAIYKLPQVDSVYIDAADYDYETVVALAANGVTHATDGKVMKFFIEDATQDYVDNDDEEAPLLNNNKKGRRAGETQTTDGKGKGHLLAKYQESEFWQGKDIERYFNLVISKNSKDSEGNYWATMYIGFDTELPAGMTAYIVDKEKTDKSSANLVLRKISNKVRMLTPIVIRSNQFGEFRLEPSKESTRYNRIPDYENLLDGIGRNGLSVNQGDANDGGCLTLGRNSEGRIGFFIYKGRNKIPAYRSYISVNKVGNAQAMTLSVDDEATGIVEMRNGNEEMRNKASWYDLSGRRVANGQKPTTKGLYIVNGKKTVIK